MKYTSKAFQPRFLNTFLIRPKRFTANAICKILLKLIPEDEELGWEFLQGEELQYCANIEGVAARFFVEPPDYEGGTHELTFMLNGQFSLYYCTALSWSELEEYGDDGQILFPYETPEGRKALERKTIAFVLDCMKNIPVDAVYHATCFNEQRGFYKIAKRLGFIVIDENLFRVPLREGGFLKVNPKATKLFSFLLYYTSLGFKADEAVIKTLKLAARSLTIRKLISN